MNYKNIGQQEFDDLRRMSDHIVLDVRTHAELKEGAIDGSLHVNFYDTSFELEIQKLDRSKMYLVYCRSGMRSRRVCEIMSIMGFDRLYNLQGGIIMYTN